MRYFIDPFGCAKNQVDAENMMASFNKAGWTCTCDPEQADLIIVNSCGFIESAKQESINAVIAWKTQYPQKKILLAGCLAQRYGAELAKDLVEADALTGCADPEGAVEAAEKLFEKTQPRMQIHKKNLPRSTKQSFAEEYKDKASGKRPLLSFPGSAYVKIAEGCDNNCSYCAIPLIRGPLRCRPVPDIVRECKQLLARGVKELCLIGQDLAAFKPSLASLLEAIAALHGFFWVRLLYLHPDHFPLDILDVMQKDSRFLPYFDIPFQHASSSILSLMNRHGNAKSYLSLINTIRSSLPDAVIRSTFLAGFPGETEEHFKELLSFQKKAALDWLGIFCYSKEEGTAAYSLKGSVSKRIAQARKASLEQAQVSITESRMNRFIGRSFDALIEESIEENSSEAPLWLGRLYCHAPDVDGAAVLQKKGITANPKPGDMVRAGVLARAGFDLKLEFPYNGSSCKD